MEQQEILFRKLADLRLERRRSTRRSRRRRPVGGNDVCGGRLPARRTARDDPGDNARADRHIDRRKGRRRSARTRPQPPRRHPPAEGNHPRHRPVQDEPVADRRAAMAEVIKYGLIGDTVLLSLLEVGVRPEPARHGRRPLELLEIVERCALAKRRLVLSDERDTDGVRMALNLGHTVSNALEAATGVSDAPRRGGGLWPSRRSRHRRVPGCHADRHGEPRDAADASVRPWPGSARRVCR